MTYRDDYESLKAERDRLLADAKPVAEALRRQRFDWIQRCVTYGLLLVVLTGCVVVTVIERLTDHALLKASYLSAPQCERGCRTVDDQTCERFRALLRKP